MKSLDKYWKSWFVSTVWTVSTISIKILKTAKFRSKNLDFKNLNQGKNKLCLNSGEKSWQFQKLISIDKEIWILILIAFNCWDPQAYKMLHIQKIDAIPNMLIIKIKLNHTLLTHTNTAKQCKQSNYIGSHLTWSLWDRENW